MYMYFLPVWKVSQQTGETCGLGQWLRSVSCVDGQGESVDSSLCLEDQGRTINPINSLSNVTEQ